MTDLKRIRTALKSQYTSHRVSFAPRNAEGLRFKVIDAQNKEMVFRLSGGEILSPNVK